MVSPGQGEPAIGRADVRSNRSDLAAAVASSLSGAGPAALASLVASAELAAVRRSDVVVAQGSTGRLILVLEGWIALRRIGERGRPLILDVVGAGGLAGGVGSNRASSLEIRAVTPAVVAAWTAALVGRLADKDPALALELVGHATEELARVVERLDRIAFEGVRARVCRALLERREICFDPVRPVLLRGDLASLVGASREMTNRVLRDLEAVGAVRRLGAHGLTLRDEAILVRTLEASGPVGRRASR